MKYKYDFHIHSCLSPCGDAQMTPANIVNMAKLLELDIIALTDHNSCLNCPSAVSLGENAGIIVVPGMELCTAEEVHIVCLFADVDNALGFSEYVEKHSMIVKNKAGIFGNQTVMNENDEPVREYENLLITASDITVDNVKAKVSAFGGVCYPAHIDRGAYSIISNLGAITREMGFACAEISDNGVYDKLAADFPVLEQMQIIRSSDAHRLEALCRDAHLIELKNPSAQSVIEFFENAEKSRC